MNSGVAYPVAIHGHAASKTRSDVTNTTASTGVYQRHRSPMPPSWDEQIWGKWNSLERGRFQLEGNGPIPGRDDHMGKKKAFINKKEAQHFHVVHRSQRDPLINDPNASKFVLLSSSKPVEFQGAAGGDDDEYDSDDDLPELVHSSAPPAAKGEVRFGNVVARDMVNEFGMVNDGYDYSKHMKEIGRGQFYSAGGTYDEGASLLTKRVVLPDEVLASTNEHERMLEAITITEDVMDEDLREALVNDDAFEELNDDFMAQAAEELPDDDHGAADGFDYDAHIAKLMAAAEGIPKYRGELSDDEDDEEFDSDEDDEDDDDEDDEDKDEAQRALDDAFEKMMAEEYDDDQVGELDEDETRGKLVLEGALLHEIVDDFVNIRQELMADEGRLGNPLRSGNRLKEILAECAADLDDDEMKPTDPAPAIEEADMSDLTSNPYLVSRVEDQWDCETIVSTYSNLDNHPTIIREPSSSKKKKKAAKAAALASTTVVLSAKTGMPLNVVPLAATAPIQEEEDESDDDERTTPQFSRGKGESKEEKKARKLAAKAHKQERRLEKKEVKLLYKDEKQRQLQNSGPGLSVFRYS
ncbi:Aste57867_1270 [Aphanomyces stellatus]|uniref:Aste57867_1270 protein n=1 Tax=Aphanomyces stellatus TaxID=120398 RepID=A0A485K4R1_9STRA|nr:hypothetical protein As57867_001269 [Aphanomyces stellatus]VFT78489.1 Aste57867_1270 [Aphanomyces stellatus]